MWTKSHLHKQGKLHLKKVKQNTLIAARRQYLWDINNFPISKDGGGRGADSMFLAQGIAYRR